MYEYLRGSLVDANAEIAVLEVQGVGYRLWIPQNLSHTLPSTGTTCLFYTTFVVKEDSQTLYGFTEKKERDLFEKLIEISGVGPKTALNLIGHIPLSAFVNALRTNHLPTFTHVPGIGKKTAERLIFELRTKLSWFSTLEIESGSPLSSQKVGDALSALLNLGFAPNIARDAVEKASKELPEECELSQLIAQALKMR